MIHVPTANQNDLHPSTWCDTTKASAIRENKTDQPNVVVVIWFTTLLWHKIVHFSDLYRPLSRYNCSAKVWSNTWIKHTTGKNKPSLVSTPIFRVTDQSTVKCHPFENYNFYKVLYGECTRLAPSAHILPYKTLSGVSLLFLVAIGNK